MNASSWSGKRVFLSVFLGVGGAVLVFGSSAQAEVPVVANVAKDPREVPASPAGDITVDLDVVEVIAEVAPGQQAWVWAFASSSGGVTGKPTVPGPMIRVKEGNHVTINLCNKLGNNEPHNIDFHAAMGPGGGAGVTTVMPGECRTLRFKALRQGAYIYHCAGEGMPWEHVSYGMYGLIQVDPRGGLEPGFQEFYVGQNDWYLIANSAAEEPRSFLDPDILVLDAERAQAEHPTMFSFNGHQRALMDPALYGEAIMVKQDSKVRFFFVTGGPNIGSNWHIIGTIFDTVYTGSRLTAMQNEETVYVAPGSAAVFELRALVPGTFLLVDHALWRVPKGAAGHMTVDCLVPRLPDGSCPTWPYDLYSPEAFGSGH